MIQIVTFKWDNGLHPKKKMKFTAEHVNVLRNMVKRHLHMPHEFVCITDDSKGIDKDIRIIPLWSDHRNLGGCYVRLKAFAKNMESLIGPRFAWMDLDTVILNDITPLFKRPDPFVMWGDTNPTTPYNGSLVLMQAGARSQVWEKFVPKTSIPEARQRGYVGTDQAWIGACLGPREPKWDTKDGVYSFRVHLQGEKGAIMPVPPNARIVFFHGSADPSHPGLREKYPWVQQNWR